MVVLHGSQHMAMYAIECNQSLSSVHALIVFTRTGQGDTNWDTARAELNSRSFDMQGCFLDTLLYGLPQSRRSFYVCGVRSAGIGDIHEVDAQRASLLRAPFL